MKYTINTRSQRAKMYGYSIGTPYITRCTYSNTLGRSRTSHVATQEGERRRAVIEQKAKKMITQQQREKERRGQTRREAGLQMVRMSGARNRFLTSIVLPDHVLRACWIDLSLRRLSSARTSAPTTLLPPPPPLSPFSPLLSSRIVSRRFRRADNAKGQTSPFVRSRDTVMRQPEWTFAT